MGKDKKIELDIVKDYQNNISAMKIAEKYLGNKNKYNKIIKIIKSHKIEIRNASHRRKIYSIDENIFDNIDCEEKAYFMGFLYADGGNVGNAIYLSLHQQDKHILETFSNILKTNKPIKTYTNNCKTIYNRLDISNKKIVSRLESLGVVPKKTFNIKFPDWLSYDLVRHFIRGYFDGDGCLTVTKTRNKALVSITSNHEFCKQLKYNIESFVDINCLINPVYGSKCDDRIKRTVISGNQQILKFLDWIYCNSNIYLERKYNKYLQLHTNPISSKKIILPCPP